jgi:hypothetical protein
VEDKTMTPREAIELAESVRNRTDLSETERATVVLADEIYSLYRGAPVVEGVPAQYLGVYILLWGKRAEPQMAFTQVQAEDYGVECNLEGDLEDKFDALLGVG